MLKKILEEFLLIDGVTTAALVGRDGFVIGIVQNDRVVDSDALGALCSGSIRFCERSGGVFEMGSLKKIILEFQDGVLSLTPVTPEEFLVIITNPTTGLGHLAYALAKTNSRIAAVM